MDHCSREEGLVDILTRVTGYSFGLLLFISGLFFLSGLIGVQISRDPDTTRIILSLNHPLFLRILEILLWDVALLVLAMIFLNPGSVKSPATEALLAFSFCFFLWRIVVVQIGYLLFPSWTSTPAPFFPPLNETLLFLLPLAAGKEWIFRHLQSLDGKLDSPLLAVFSWHHRKDAIFNILFGITVLANLFALSPHRVFLLTALAKIYLMGSAAWNITLRCCHIIATPGSETECCKKS